MTKQQNNINNVKLNFIKLDPQAVIPFYAHYGDVGMDLTAINVEYDSEIDTYIYHTGLAFESDFNYGMFIYPRSSNRKKDAYLTNSTGIIDCAIYRGEVILCYKNRDSIDTIAEREGQKALMQHLTQSNPSEGYTNAWIRDGVNIYNATKNEIYEKAKNLEYAPYKIGDKIGQLVVFNYPQVELTEVDKLSDTERGANGFGSTGN